jgi:hypothetical protein
MRRLRLRPLDAAAVLLALALFLVSLTLTVAQNAERKIVRIQGAGDEWVYPLDAEVEVDVPGPLGLTHVNISEGSVWVSESPCTEKICIATGAVSRAGAWIACLPNRVFVQVEGVADGEVDQVVY